MYFLLNRVLLFVFRLSVANIGEFILIYLECFLFYWMYQLTTHACRNQINVLC